MTAGVKSLAGPQMLSSERAQLLELLLARRSKQLGPIRPYPREQVEGAVRIAASCAQQRLWFIDQLQGAGAAYNSPIALRLSGPLDVNALRKAFEALVERHETLRTVFVNVQGEPMQEIAATGGFVLTQHDLSAASGSEQETLIRQHKLEEGRLPFDLRAGPLFRGRLLRTASDQHVLLITKHHIISDGWSMMVLVRELGELYSAKSTGREASLAPLPIQYADYALWQKHATTEIHDAQLKFWREALEGAPAALQLPLDRPRPAMQGYRGQNVPVELDPTTSAHLNAVARRHGLTLFMLLNAAWALLLSRLSGQEEIVIGTPVANRRRPEVEGLIGFFVNTLALRVRVDGERSLKDYFEHVRKLTLSACDHQDVPFERVVEVLRPQRSLNCHPIFQVMFALQNAPQSEWQFANLRARLEEGASDSSKFDLLLSLEEREGQLVGWVNYDTDLFDRETIERWGACFVTLLRAVASETHLRVGELPILPEEERRRVVEAFNLTRASYPREKLIHEVFEERVEQAPLAPAAMYEDESITYAALNTLANRLARQLRSQGLTAGELVPICMSRSIGMLVAQLAVLKCGGVYVPMDSEMPAERLAFMIRDCSARRIIVDGSPPTGLAIDDVQWIDYSAAVALASEHGAGNLGLSLQSSAPAYVMYTSGSTGTPKGVVVPHSAVTRLAINNGYAQISATDCLVHYSNPAFDASTFEIWGALLVGARLVVVPSCVVLEANRFAERLNHHGVTVLWISVGLFNQYTEALAPVFRRLRYLLVGGDSLEPGAIRRVLQNSAPEHLLNMYGPTECTTFSTRYFIDRVDADAKGIPIGQPISNAQIYILDRFRQPVPVGVAGEIYIGGAGVACGYLNRSELTAERFVSDPFGGDPAARLYRTGDLARWRADGAVEFLGRNDHQIKLRGFRIELGEIEAQLTGHPDVKDAVVVAQGDATGEKRLVAYVVPAAGEEDQRVLYAEALRTHLRVELPEHMVPSAFVVLERLPLTPNGKVDRRALPAPGLGDFSSGRHESPQGDLEALLAGIWQRLLHVEHIGRDDSFFDLGGHSLLAVKALFEINQALGTSLNVSDIYRSPTIRALGARARGDAVSDDFVDGARESVLDPDIVPTPQILRAAPHGILLTGGTGFVGRFLLARLLEETRATIYCLVRAPSQSEASSRLRLALKKWDLWHEAFASRVVAIPGDLRAPRLGIADLSYGMLSRAVDTIYHCATSMNHLETYEMAKPANVGAARELLRLATTERPKVIHYLSTLSVFSPGTSANDRVVHEMSPIDDEKHTVSNGYAASKWVAERIFMAASQRGIPCNIFRLGLVWADTEQGRYDELQRDYRILKSALLSGYGIKDYRYASVPTAVDHVAQAVVHLAGQHPDGGGVFHISAPDKPFEQVFERCNEIAGVSLELVPLYDWIGEMKRLHQAGRSLPVVPLIEFAFAMDEQSFYERQEKSRTARTSFDSAQTARELAEAQIVAPTLTDERLRLCVEDMGRRDPDLRPLFERQHDVRVGNAPLHVWRSE